MRWLFAISALGLVVSFVMHLSSFFPSYTIDTAITWPLHFLVFPICFVAYYYLELDIKREKRIKSAPDSFAYFLFVACRFPFHLIAAGIFALVTIEWLSLLWVLRQWDWKHANFGDYVGDGSPLRAIIFPLLFIVRRRLKAEMAPGKRSWFMLPDAPLWMRNLFVAFFLYALMSFGMMGYRALYHPLGSIRDGKYVATIEGIVLKDGITRAEYFQLRANQSREASRNWMALYSLLMAHFYTRWRRQKLAQPHPTP